MPPFPRPRLLGGVALIMAIVATTSCAPFRPPAGTLHVSPGGSGDECSRDAPCGSLDTAYRRAAPGAVVVVAAGTYGPQRIRDDPAHREDVAPVTFRPERGARVVLADLVNDGAWNTRYSGFEFPLTQADTSSDANHAPDACDCGPSVTGGTGVVMADMRAAGFYIGSETVNRASHVTFAGGVYGPRLEACPGGGNQIMSRAGDIADTSKMPHHIVLDGITVTDMTVERACPAGQDHMDCIHVGTVDGLIIRNSVISNCENYGVFVQSNGSPAPDHILVENNWFGPVGTNCGFALRGAPEDFSGSIVIRFNSGSCLTAQTSNRISDAVIQGNAVSSIAPCRAGVRSRDNVVLEGSPLCGPGDRAVETLGFFTGEPAYSRRTAADRLDFHLASDSPAIGAGGSGLGPERDIDGDVRPRRGPLDAGGDQRSGH